MTESRRDPGRSSGVDDIRAELGDELLRAARAHRQPRRLPRGRRLALSLAAVVMAAVPASFAVAALLPDEGPLPAPPPLFAPGGEFAECPVEVRESLLKLEQLSDYPETPGYPVAGCPTLEQIRENEAANAELERGQETFKRLAR
jgi:hypothetical protein